MRYVFLLLAFVFCACESQDPKSHIQHLPGYWEISQVHLPDGTQRDFKINTLIDFIEVQGDSGNRKKLAPKLDGTFQTTKVAEQFFLKIEGNNLQLHYKTPYAEWTETVLESGDSLLKVKNEDGKIYTYKKFKPFNFSE